MYAHAVYAHAVAAQADDSAVSQPGQLRLGEVLVAAGACTREAVQRALHNQQFWGGRLGTNLLRLRAVREADLAAALQLVHGVPALSGELRPDPRALHTIARDVVERYEVIPYLAAADQITLLVRDPSDLRVLDDMRFATGRSIAPLVVAEARMWSLLWKTYGIERGLRSDREGIDEVGEQPAGVHPYPGCWSLADGRWVIEK